MLSSIVLYYLVLLCDTGCVHSGRCYLVLLCDTGCVHSGRCTKYVVKCMVQGFRRELSFVTQLEMKAKTTIHVYVSTRHYRILY